MRTERHNPQEEEEGEELDRLQAPKHIRLPVAEPFHKA